MTINHQTLTFDVEHQPREPALGIPRNFHIKRVYWKDIDITEFVDDYCAPLYEKWEDELIPY